MLQQSIGIVEIAEFAGVSTATVSRAMNSKGGVSGETRKRVVKLAQKHGYLPKASVATSEAKFPAVKNIVFLSVDAKRREAMHSYILSEVLHGVEERLTSKGISLTFVNAKDSLPSTVTNSAPEGIIVLGPLKNEELCRGLSHYPTVSVLPHTFVDKFVQVSHDDSLIGTMAYKYLVNRGHKKIAVLNAVPMHEGCMNRVALFELTARNAGFDVLIFESKNRAIVSRPISVSESFNYNIGFDMDCLRDFVDYLKKSKERPTGLFCASDRVTCKLYQLLWDAGIKPMKDIDIISCDNEKPAMALMEPRPAIIDIGAYDIGQEAVDVLLGKILLGKIVNGGSGERNHIPRRVLVPPKLISPEGEYMQV